MKDYSLRFGQIPLNLIERKSIGNDVIENLSLDFPTTNSYIITGVRGSGKTVLLTYIAQAFENKKDWIVVDINPENEILPQIVSSIYDSKHFRKLSIKANFNFSFHGLGISIEGKEPLSDVRSILEKMLAHLKKSNIKVLLCIDEVSNTNTVRSFVHDFQYFVRKDSPLFLIMTGLAENVESLQNNKALTFLLRTPKVFLEPLDVIEIKNNYISNFKISNIRGLKLAELTKGYAFAFQVVGLLYKKYKNIDKMYDELDLYLSSYVYDKIWSSIPETEKKILKSFINDERLTINEILKRTKIDKKAFSVYRDRLIKRGILSGANRGELSLVLPRFNNYIQKRID